VLLRTKLFRPPIPRDYVVRQRLLDKIEQGRSHPLILVSAPAGYGKTVLVSSFLETCPLPAAWLSLDENDNDFGLFLGYLLAALDTVFPGSLHRTQLFLTKTSLPPVSAIADSLISELAELESDFILVLDDLHAIHAADVYNLLAALLRHPLPALHLVLVTRQDPPLALGHLRAYDQMTEIRSRDLRFSAEETAAFLAAAVSSPIRDEALVVLAERTEGWAAGLRLAALTLRYGGDIDGQVAGLHAENRHVIDYLMNEVLSRVPPETEDFLVKTSILDLLCGPLCDAVMAVDDMQPRGQAILQGLDEANLFTVSLDEQGFWYRYHNLFHGILRTRLTQRVDAATIDAMHRRASTWYAARDSVESALRHALAGHDTLGAVQLVAQRRHHLLNCEERPLLARWLRVFPTATLAQHPDLLLSAAWIAELDRSDSQTVLHTVAQAQALVDNMVGEPEHARQLQGEISTLLSIEKGFAANDPQGTIALAAQALESVPQEWYLVRVEAWLHLALAYQMSGQLDRAYAALAAAQQDETTNMAGPRARLIGSQCFIYWIAADLTHTLQSAQLTVTFSRLSDYQRESLGWGRYLLASCYYQHNDLASAELHANAVLEQRHACHRITVVQSAIVLAAIHQARGQSEEARLALDRVNSFLVEIRSEALQPLVQAFAAELAALQGDLDTAAHWAVTVGPLVPLGLMAFFYAPSLTLPKVLLRLNTPAARQQAGEALSRLQAFVTATHNTRFRIDVLALQALCYDAQGDAPGALQALEQAVALAQPNGFIRNFVDLGFPMAGLLERLSRRGFEPDYIQQILQAFHPYLSRSAPLFPPSPGLAAQVGLVEPLTNRELDVLVLLAKRFSAKEIAQDLVISDATVKRHLANIYDKLAVNSRRDAVAAAIALGILPPQP
jgi:LuxR family transcriptional regulator, maltose regulon positive regulatory protein